MSGGTILMIITGISALSTIYLVIDKKKKEGPKPEDDFESNRVANTLFSKGVMTSRIEVTVSNDKTDQAIISNKDDDTWKPTVGMTLRLTTANTAATDLGIFEVMSVEAPTVKDRQDYTGFDIYGSVFVLNNRLKLVGDSIVITIEPLTTPTDDDTLADDDDDKTD